MNKITRVCVVNNSELDFVIGKEYQISIIENMMYVYDNNELFTSFKLEDRLVTFYSKKHYKEKFLNKYRNDKIDDILDE